MEQKQALGKFPIFTTEILKSDSRFHTTGEIVDFFKSKIEAHPMVVYIATFDHYNHTKKVGAVPSEILDVQNVIFCFGPQIPDVDMVAVRPRSIGITEYSTHFIINFLEAPGAMPNQVMMQWVAELQS
jgi:hypothetical protein